MSSKMLPKGRSKTYAISKCSITHAISVEPPKKTIFLQMCQCGWISREDGHITAHILLLIGFYCLLAIHESVC